MMVVRSVWMRERSQKKLSLEDRILRCRASGTGNNEIQNWEAGVVQRPEERTRGSAF